MKKQVQQNNRNVKQIEILDLKNTMTELMTSIESYNTLSQT